MVHEVQVAKPVSKESGKWESIRILVVDDEESVCESMKMILGIKDYEVVAVLSGFEAIEALKKSKFDIVLTDIRMPGMDGLEVLRKVKEYDPEIEVIIVTAYPSLDNSVEAMRLGALDFLTKPFLMEQVYQMVDRAYRKRKENLKKKECLEIVRNKEASKEIMPEANELLQKIIAAAHNINDYKVLTKEVIKIIREKLHHHVLTLYLPETKELFIDINQNVNKGFIEKIIQHTLDHAVEYGAEKVPSAQVSRQIEVNNAALQEGDFNQEIPTFVASPLKAGNNLVALMAISSTEKEVYSRAVLDIFTSIPDSAAIVIENALLKRLRK